MLRRYGRSLGLVGLAIAITGVLAVPASSRMVSTQIGKHLCETTGGGRFVKIPGFPGEKIDRRLLKDVAWMKRRYTIFITDGFSTDPIHSPNGEHPLGLAADIVPHRAKGGNWRKITRLAKRFEPRQNRVKMPFRWIGYNGDPGHGRGHHLHLSWSHGRKTRFGRPTWRVYTRICPKEPRNADEQQSSGGSSGGTGPGKGGWPGISDAEMARIAPPVAERH
jgi:hypothetical protein